MPNELRLFSVGIFKDPVSASTHFAGFLAAIAGLWVLVSHSPAEVPKLASLSVYGGTLVLLFLASSCYHFFDLGERGNKWLRRVDHSAVFLMIAGTYVPALTHTLDGTWRVAMLASIGGVTLLGIVFKLLWVDCPRWLSVGLYLLLGWAVLVPAHRIFPNLSGAAMAWLVGGGVAYTAGAIIYATKRPDPWPKHFGFHEIWHCFVLAGAAAHYGFAYEFIGTELPPF